MKPPILSIYIPTYNRPRELIQLLECLKHERVQLTDPAAVEIIVSDNASDTCIRSLIEPNHYDRWFHQEENIGADANILLSRERASGTYLWCIGDDDLIAQDALKKIVDVLTKISIAQCGLFYLNATITTMDGKVVVDRVVSDVTSGIYKPCEAFKTINGNLLTLSTFILRNDSGSRHFSKQYGSRWLCSPLCMSLDGLCNGDVYIFESPLVIYRNNDRPWFDAWLAIDVFYRPYIMHLYAINKCKSAIPMLFKLDYHRYRYLISSIFTKTNIEHKIKLYCLLQYMKNSTFYLHSISLLMRVVLKPVRLIIRN